MKPLEPVIDQSLPHVNFQIQKILRFFGVNLNAIEIELWIKRTKSNKELFGQIKKVAHTYQLQLDDVLTLTFIVLFRSPANNILSGNKDAFTKNVVKVVSQCQYVCFATPNFKAIMTAAIIKILQNNLFLSNDLRNILVLRPNDVMETISSYETPLVLSSKMKIVPLDYDIGREYLKETDESPKHFGRSNQFLNTVKYNIALRAQQVLVMADILATNNGQIRAGIDKHELYIALPTKKPLLSPEIVFLADYRLIIIPTTIFFKRTVAAAEPVEDDKTAVFADLIYRVFIKACHFDDGQHIPAKFAPVCLKKPDKAIYSRRAKLEEKIKQLKSQNFVYDDRKLQRLLKIVSSANIKPIYVSDEDVLVLSSDQVIFNALKQQQQEQEQEQEQLEQPHQQQHRLVALDEANQLIIQRLELKWNDVCGAFFKTLEKNLKSDGGDGDGKIETPIKNCLKALTNDYITIVINGLKQVKPRYVMYNSNHNVRAALAFFAQEQQTQLVSADKETILAILNDYMKTSLLYHSYGIEAHGKMLLYCFLGVLQQLAKLSENKSANIIPFFDKLGMILLKEVMQQIRI
jgi:hypothetical protein